MTTAETDVAIVGAGPAGLSAAIAAASSGANITLIDGYSQPGGQYFKQLPAEFTAMATTPHQHQAEVLFNQLNHPNITLFTDTLVWGIYEDNLLTLHGPQAPTRLQAKTVILASGAYDRPVAFPGWTNPGVMATGAAQTMLKHQRTLPGRRILLVGTGPLQLATAAGLIWAGAEVVAVLEGNSRLIDSALSRSFSMWGQWNRLVEGITYYRTLLQAGVPYRFGWGLVKVLGEARAGVEGAVIAKLDADWRPIPGTEQTVECDTICVGYGFVPSTELSRLAGAEHCYRTQLGGWIPVRDQFMQTTLPNLYAVGDGAGIGGAPLAMIEGRIAGLVAASRGQKGELPANMLTSEIKTLARERRFQQLYGRLFTPGAGLDALAEDDTIICRCETVTLAQVKDAISMGADTVTAVKGLTRTGMGECQGRICGSLVAAQVAHLTGRDVPAVGTYTARPPIHPLPLEVLAAAKA